MKKIAAVLLGLCLALSLHAETMVFAAASTTNVMKELADAYTAETGESIVFNFASSGALARQIDAGAPADIFLSANTKWMTFLIEKGLVDKTTAYTVAENELVLIAPPGGSFTVEMTPEFDFASAFSGRLAVGDFASVPAGSYAAESLKSLGWFDALANRYAKGDNVRNVLFFVEQGEVDAGIVYTTDAVQSGKVEIIGTFPADTHAPIVYPVALCSGAAASTKGFLEFIGSAEAAPVWERYGFRK